MRTIMIGLFVTGATAVLASPDQTIRPGEMTEGRVWVQNRGSSEALPVDLREVNIDRPIRVQVMNGIAGEVSATQNPVNVRVARPIWEYKSIMVDLGADPVMALNAEGVNGWETTGIVAEGQGKRTLLLKRAR